MRITGVLGQKEGMDHSDVEKQRGTLKWDRVISYIHALYVFSKSKRES